MGRSLPPHVLSKIPVAALEDTRPHAERMALILPFPPSVNSLYPTIITKTGKILRTKSKAGKAFDAAVKQVVGLWINHHQLQAPAPPWAITMRAYPPQDGRKHDLSNLAKAPEDAVMAAIGGDDNDVLVWAAMKMPADPYPRIELTLESAHTLGVPR